MIRRCYECRRFYLPWWHGDAVIQAQDARGVAIAKPIHGHPTCMMRALCRG